MHTKAQHSENYYTLTIEMNNGREIRLPDQGKDIGMIEKLKRQYERMRIAQLARRYCDSEQYEKALELYSKMVNLEPENAVAYCNRAYIFSQLGQDEKAIEDYSRAIELDPNDADFFCGRGRVYNKLGKPMKAIEDYEKAIQINPELSTQWELGVR